MLIVVMINNISTQMLIVTHDMQLYTVYTNTW